MSNQAKQIPKLPRLKVSADGHFLVTEDGSPFFWLGDTGWSLCRIAPGDVDLYLSNRAEDGFNVIQVNCGYAARDYDGNRPYLNHDTDTPDEAFWRNMDSIVSKARDHGLYIALVCMWGADYNKAFEGDTEKAYRLGQWLGARYGGHSHVLWIVSGEYDKINDRRVPILPAQKDLFNSLAQGLREGHAGTQLMTIHPDKVFTSSVEFHHETWLDFNILESGHTVDREMSVQPEVHALIANDYQLVPAKPVLDGEPFYEDTPDGVWEYSDATRPRGGADVVRRKAYWAVFAGACGHTYGHNDVYGFFEPPHPGAIPVPPKGSGQRGNWRDALDAPGATQMKYLRALMESLPFLKGIPDQSVLASSPGTGRNHVRATRASDGSYALVYLPAGGTVEMNMDMIASAQVKGQWFDPRTGDYTEIGMYPNHGTRAFIAPGEPKLGNDWVLVLASPTLRK